jgi:hypothetical protein
MNDLTENIMEWLRARLTTQCIIRAPSSPRAVGLPEVQAIFSRNGRLCVLELLIPGPGKKPSKLQNVVKLATRFIGGEYEHYFACLVVRSVEDVKKIIDALDAAQADSTRTVAQRLEVAIREVDKNRVELEQAAESQNKSVAELAAGLCLYGCNPALAGHLQFLKEREKGDCDDN